jgi:hypothetical protein
VRLVGQYHSCTDQAEKAVTLLFTVALDAAPDAETGEEVLLALQPSEQQPLLAGQRYCRSVVVTSTVAAERELQLLVQVRSSDVIQPSGEVKARLRLKFVMVALPELAAKMIPAVLAPRPSAVTCILPRHACKTAVANSYSGNAKACMCCTSYQ